MKPRSSLLLALATCLILRRSLTAGAIRPTAQMGPRARRLLAGIRQERTRRDRARRQRQVARRIAILRVRTPGDDPDMATRVAREMEEELGKRGFRVRPYRKVWPRVQQEGTDLLASPHTLRQLCRKLGIGRAVQVTVQELRLTTGREAGLATPSWWGPEELAQEFAEAHLRLQIFDAAAGEVVVDRQDRQHQLVPTPREGEASLRGAVLGEVLGRVTDHLLFDLQGPSAASLDPHAESPPGASRTASSGEDSDSL